MLFLYRIVRSALTFALTFIITVCLSVICFLVIVGAISVGKAYGMDHGFDVNDPRTVWMEKQLTPRHNQSCCGKGDGYFVDRYRMNADSSYTVYIEDSGDVTFPDGTERPRLIAQEFVVPVEAVNSLDDDIDNPFDHSVVWLTVYQGRVSKVWCFIRHPQSY